MVVLRVSMHCNGCARKVERHISKMEVGVFRKKGTKLYEASLKDEKRLDQWLHC
ncbi:hypothetical protein ACSBR2_005898 [Camellia fascicularis]